MSLTGLLLDQAVDHPVHFILEITFATVLTYVLLRKRRGKPTKPIYKWPSLEEQERRLAAFRSEPFRAEYATTSNVTAGGTTDLPEVEARSGVHLTVHKGHFDEPTECLDLGTYDYHSFSTNPDILDTARKTVMAYGVGSCGPRGFYGTVKPHLDAEENIAKFLHTEDAVVYSFAYATVSTLISCYAGKGDYLVYDGMCNSSIVEGCRLCRANLSIFRHNDMTSLEEELKAIVAKENPNKPNRRYVVTEGVFKNMGDMCPLPAILALCDKYKFRLILEDSYGFGAVGPTGRGTPEHYGIPTSKVDVYVGSLSTSLGAVGGFCAGAIAVTDFQRLGASAYVFSASLPPYITASAAKAIELLDKQKDFTTRLHERTRAMRGALRSANFNAAKIRLVECVDDASPVIVLAVQDDYVSVTGREKVDQQLAMVVKAIERRKIVILRHIYAEDEPTKNVPSLRLVAKGQATEAELNEALNVIVSAVKEQFN